MAQQPPKPPSDGVRPPRHPMYGNSPTSPTSPLRATTATPAGASLEDVLTKDDQAERGLLLSMEERRTPFQTAGGDAWHASVAGERPPLGGAVPLDRLLPPPIVATTGHHQRMSSINTSNSHVSRNSHASRNSSMGSSRSSQHSVTKLADIARRMRQKTAAADGRTLSGSAGAPQQQQQQQHLGGVNGNTASSFNENSVLSSITGIESHNATSSNLYHRRAPSRAHALLDSIQEQPDNQDGGVDSIFDSVGGSGNNTGEPDNQTGGAPSDLNQTMTHTDHLLTGAMQVEELFDDTLAIPPPISSSSIVPPEKNAEGSLQVQDFNEDINNTSETTPLNAPYHSYQYSVDSVIGDGVNMALDDTINNHVSDTHKSNSSHASTSKGQTNSHSVPHSHKKTSPMMMNAKHARQKAANNKKRSKLLLWALCHPWLLVQSIIRFLWYQTLLFSVTLPCVLLSALFFYVLSNPTWSFLPGHASVSWWFNFIGRQTILFEVARLWQWCLIDKIVLGTRIAVQCLGPLLTLCFIQARGWPFCIASWGFLDLLLLEGSSNLASHWFWFSNLSMYSQLDSGAYILNSDIYIRLLMSMIVAGIAVAIKRTSVAMSFGRRTFVEFKPRLEKLLKEVVLVSELAALAEEAELAASEELMEVQVDNKEQQRVTNVKFMGDVSWSNNNRRRDGHSPTKNVVANENETTDSDDDDDGDDDDESDDEDSEITTQNDILPERQSFRARQLSSTSCVLQGLLDHWEEPINKADKSLNASISDILRFRRALTFMDDDLMFGETFGPASTREQLINSAHRVYNRLLMLTPGREKVSCEFYDMLAQEDNGKLNNKKRKALRKLFRPNGANEISLLAFVRSCDALYKKLRYFRANVGNASIIDHALESIVDGAFGFILALVLLSVMRVNPWPLLVSISTLLVSISFAVGSSASKWFEGMLLVAARRPFDLGDRIYMTDPSLVISDGLWYCWFVEDINLFHTTVRYAGTNEVATINNGSVANMRIINGARSPNAAVWFQFAFRPNLMEDGNMDNIKAALEGYARDNPQNWHSFGYFRVDEVHPDVEKLVVTIGMQHRSSWQDLVRILESKASIMCWLMEYCRKLGVLYDELPKRELMYYAGDLKEGGVRQHRFQLHGPTNITNGGFNNLGSPPHSSVPNSPIPTGAKPKTASDATFLERLKHSHG